MAGIKSKSKRSKSKVKSKPRNLFPFVLILIGAVLVSYAGVSYYGINWRLETVNNKQETSDISPQYSKVKSINIPKIKKNLDVTDGRVVDGKWEVAAEGVSYYTSSSLPDAGGNTVLYGHNKARILGGLVTMKVGDKIELKLENGQLRNYEVVETKTIKPTDVEILNQTGQSQLTIYTCTGFLDSARFVVLAHLI